MYKLRIGFGTLIFVMFVSAFFASLGFHRLAMYYPVTASGLGAILSGIYVVQQILAARRAAPQPTSPEGATLRKAIPYIGWFVGYVVLIRLLGIHIATAIFLGSFLLRVARMRKLGVAISMTAAVVLLHLFGNLMNLHWPANLLGL